MKKIHLMLIASIMIAALCGCGKKDEQLEQYKADMTAFTDEIDELVTAIENIDLNSENRTQELLGYLDEMDAAFAKMGGLEVPEQFSNIEDLADEASENLSEAVALYHQAFDYPDNYDPQIIDAALEYYSRAFKRLDYIGTILQGEIPDDENITIISDDEDESYDAKTEDDDKIDQD